MFSDWDTATLQSAVPKYVRNTSASPTTGSFPSRNVLPEPSTIPLPGSGGPSSGHRINPIHPSTESSSKPFQSAFFSSSSNRGSSFSPASPFRIFLLPKTISQEVFRYFYKWEIRQNRFILKTAFSHWFCVFFSTWSRRNVAFEKGTGRTKGAAMSATTQGFIRSVSEHLLLERIGSLETRLSQLEKLIKKLQKTTASEASHEAEASTPA